MDEDVRKIRESFLERFPILTRKKGQVLFFQGETPQFAYIVKKGIIKAYNISTEGFEQLVFIHSRGDTFPLPWVLDTVPVALCYYQAVTDCELFRIPKTEYQEFLRHNTNIMFEELKRSAFREINQTSRLTAILQSKANDKLMHTIRYLVQNHGIVLGHNLVKINLALTQQDIANLTGLRRETVAMELNKLKDQGIIYYRPRSLYHIDVGLLNKVLGEENINTVSIVD